MKAILPIAGNGTRMYPLGITTPKCLIPILNKPLVMWSIEALQKSGIDEVILVINAGELGQKIRDFFAAHPVENMKLQFAVQTEQQGTAHVVQMAKDFFQAGEQFIFLYGDDIYGPQNIQQVVNQPSLAVTGMKVSDPEKWGIFQTNGDGNLARIVEKPVEQIGDLANIGCMKLDTRIFDVFSQLQKTERGEYELTDSLTLLATTEKIRVLTNTDYWIPIGYPWHILEATEFLAPRIESKIEGTVEENVVIKGKVILPKSSTIKSGTYIEGNLIVGENTVIGPSAYIRQNVVVGDKSQIGFSVEIKNSVIGSQTFIPHLSYMGDSILGNNINFAGGSLATNWRHDEKTISTPIKEKMVDTKRTKFGTVIGDGVKLGAGTKIYPGRKIWPQKTTLPGEIVTKDLK